MIEISFNTSLAQNDITEEKIDLRCIATSEEMAEIAKRLEVLRVSRLKANLSLQKEGAAIVLQGTLTGSVAQECVVTLREVRETVKAPVYVKLYPPHTPRTSFNDYLLLEFDEEYLDNDEIMVGELMTQYLALSINPYPRHEEASLEDWQDIRAENKPFEDALKKLLH